MIDTGLMLSFTLLDKGFEMSKKVANNLFSLVSKSVPEKREANANMLRQFSLQWIIHNVPLRDGIILSYDEFLTAIKRFGNYYHTHTIEDQLKSFYEIAAIVWQKFKSPPTPEEIKHALLEIAAKTLDHDLNRREILSNDVGLGHGLFQIAQEFYQEKTLPNESSLIAKVFQSFDGILQQEKHVVEVCKDYYSFLKDFINVHFPISKPSQNLLQKTNLPQKVCSQIQIIGIKGFLVWKRVMNGYNVSRGWAKAQKTNTLIFWSFLNDVRLLIPVFNPNLAQIKKLGEYYILKVKLQLIKNQDQIILYHGMVKQRWVTFKIKTIKQLRYLLKTLAENVEILNHKANKLYQEALDHIKSKKKQIVSYHQLDTPYTSNSTPENLTNQSEIISDQQVAQLNQLNHQQVSEPQEQVQEQQQKRSESIEEDLLRDQQQQSDQQRELSQDEQCDLKYAQKLSEVKTPEQHSDKKQNDEDPQNIEKEDTLKVGEFRDYKEAKVEIQHNNEDIKSESNNDGPKGEQ